MEIIIPIAAFALLFGVLITGTVMLATADLLAFLTTVLVVLCCSIFISLVVYIMTFQFKMIDFGEIVITFTIYLIVAFLTALLWLSTAEIIGLSREKILEEGDRKEVAVLYITGNKEPTVHMENGRSAEIDMDNVVISEDGKNRAVAYDLDVFFPWGQLIETHSEYTLYLTPEVLREAGIILFSDENQTECDIPAETED